jgi:cyclopropane-fatty-acyl-phospholipid synthase
MASQYRQRIERLLAGTGVTIDGKEPWDIRVKDDRFYARVLAEGALGFGEAYMDGWWECDRTDECINKVMRSDVRSKLRVSPGILFDYLLSRLINRQALGSAAKNAQAHYDLGNDLFTAMLDKRLVYTCGYWKDATTLDAAQEAKLDLVCRKLSLKAGQRVLDIGCGWGSFAKFAAEKYGAHVVGVTVSPAQVELGKKLCAGLPVELRLQDYREVNERFDHIVSLGMLEHVGYKNYRTYFQLARRCLKDDGLFLLHTIGSAVTTNTIDPWMGKYIFPNGTIPSGAQLSAAAEKLFIMEDWHNFSADYDTTLMAWHANFEAHWPQLKEKYDERFRRMWRHYLLICAGAFRARANQLWQIVYSPHGVPGGYRSVR